MGSDTKDKVILKGAAQSNDISPRTSASA